MGVSRFLLLLVCVVTSTCECSAELECEDNSDTTYILLAGEALYYVHYDLKEDDAKLGLTWSRNTSSVELISSDEQERIHYHGHALFILNPLPEDSGTYTARLIDESGVCNDFSVKVEVLDASERRKPPYGSSGNFGLITCSSSVKKTCETFGGNYTWYKEYKLLQGRGGYQLRVDKKDVGVYTCICTWSHNHRAYNSSSSRRLVYNEPSARPEVRILSPMDKEQLFADPSAELKLNCTVFCGINVKRRCYVSWSINGVQANLTEGYYQTTEQVIEEPQKNTIATATLVIRRVSEEDFQAEFKCSGEDDYTHKVSSLTLKRRASIIPFGIAATCVLLSCVLAVVLVKYFAIELALCFRPHFPLWSHEKDVRQYDAYVVYQTHSLDTSTEDTLGQFVTQTLPSVLEDKCGYRLFIHGRDDIPGQDMAELVESSMKQSRRLLVILTPESGAGSEVSHQGPASLTDSVIGGFDWQVGLHHALLQMEMSVILIQLGDTGPQGYSRLPFGLQHLIRKSAPIRWPEGSWDAAAHNSRFWKRVRYLMPARPARSCPQSAVV